MEKAIKSLPIDQIKTNPSNPRFIKDENFKKLVKSIKDFPKMLFLRPLILDEDNMVLGGNMRLKACMEVGLTEVPTISAADLTKEEEDRFIIVDNVGFGEWDWEMLANEWEESDLDAWGLETPNKGWGDGDAEDDDYEIPDEIKTSIVLGDLIEIGAHRLLCGSSTETDTWEKLMNGLLSDMVLTDPPYNVDYQGGDRTEMKARNRRLDGKKIQNDKMDDSQFYQFLLDFYTALASYTKKGAAWYIWHADMESINFRSAMIEAGITPKQNLIWKKNSMVMGRQDYHWQHEPCLYGWIEGAAHGWYSDRKQTTILEFDRPTRSKEHPTMKPIPLFGYQIANSSKEGDVITDAFLGSGTTMVAAQQMGRRCYGMELDPKYCQVIIDRMKALDGSLEIKINGKVLS